MRHYLRQEPSAVIPLAGICGGGRGKPRFLLRLSLGIVGSATRGCPTRPGGINPRDPGELRRCTQTPSPYYAYPLAHANWGKALVRRDQFAVAEVSCQKESGKNARLFSQAIIRWGYKEVGRGPGRLGSPFETHYW